MKQSLFPSTSRCRIPRREEDKPTSFNSAKSKQKQEEQEICSSSSSNSRDPFQDLSNGGSIILNASSSNASSSVSSIEAPRGCLRFFLNHSSKPTSNNSNRRKNPPVKLNKPISSAKTPNSRPNTQPKRTVSERIRRGNAAEEQVKGTTQRQSGRNVKPSSRVSALKKSVGRVKPGSGDCNRARSDTNSNTNSTRSDTNSTPLRTAGGASGLNVADIGGVAVADEGKGTKDHSSSLKSSNSESSNTKTPPLRSTVSPEIQCPSSVISTANKSVNITPVCYGAGHLLSGVTDKRKCRPRGLLVVGEDIVVDKFEIDDDHDSGRVLIDGSNAAIDLSPSALPVKASMHWLRSPGEEAEGGSRNGAHNRCGLELRAANDSPALPSSSCSYNASDMSDENNMRTTRSSRSQSPEFGGFPLAANLSSDMDISPLEERLIRRDGDRHPFSTDLLSSVNVVQTSESDTSCSRVRNIVTRWSIENTTTKGWGSELDSVDRHLQKLFSTPPPQCPATPSLRFDLSTTTSDPVDLLQLQKSIDIRDARLSTSTWDDMSRSEVRISWRDGLVSRIFELDELDCCKCLSDEDEGTEENDSANTHQKCDQTRKLDIDDLRNDKTPDARIGNCDREKHCLDGNVKDDPLCLPAAESMAISSDGGALFLSDNSDWTQCYKNQLFKV